jgi:transcriptional regulator with PAS, ATPase and Fis domain
MRGLGQGDAFARFVHASESTERLVRDARRLAHSNLSVLITGETGTGKSLLARCIHLESERRHAPFVVEEGGAFTSELLESTLFGHVRGAFTGADRARKGLFELAHGGTLFLDGIDEAPMAVQAKLLRVLVEGVVRPMGSEREKRVDVRILSTLRHPSDERIPTRLREDLFYRLAGATLAVPPLRTRAEDVSAILRAQLAAPPASQLSAAAMRALLNHPWPGNVRELEHVLAQAKLLAIGGIIDVAHLQLPAFERESDLHQLRGALTRELVAEALQRNQQNRTRAALELGISRFGLQKMLKRIASEPDKGGA